MVSFFALAFPGELARVPLHGVVSRSWVLLERRRTEMAHAHERVHVMGVQMADYYRPEFTLREHV